MTATVFTSSYIERSASKHGIEENRYLRFKTIDKSKDVSKSSNRQFISLTPKVEIKNSIKLSSYSSLDYGTKKRAKIFDYIVNNYSYSNSSINKIIRFIHRNNINTRVIDEYAVMAESIMSVRSKTLAVLKDEFSPEKLYIDLKLNTSGETFMNEFDSYIDEYLIHKDSDKDKINVIVA